MRSEDIRLLFQEQDAEYEVGLNTDRSRQVNDEAINLYNWCFNLVLGQSLCTVHVYISKYQEEEPGNINF